MSESQLFEMVGRLLTQFFFQAQVAQVELAKMRQENESLHAKLAEANGVPDEAKKQE